jgi:hypothetical protein
MEEKTGKDLSTFLRQPMKKNQISIPKKKRRLKFVPFFSAGNYKKNSMWVYSAIGITT